MPEARGFLGSSIGRKIVMAVTGVILVGFVLGHLFGNLQIYLPNGREAMNAYGEFLRHFLHGAGLWIARAVLLAAVILPLVLMTATRGLRSQFDRHVRIARWTLPLWLYVSVTGVIVYLMLYQLY